jgi:hypothetical protein
MALADTAPPLVTPDPGPRVVVPEALGECRYCHNALYYDSPVVCFPGGAVSHVACEIDQRRSGGRRFPEAV